MTRHLSSLRAFLGMLALAALPLAACRTPLDVDTSEDQLLRTSADAYTLSRIEGAWELRIPYRYDNRTGGSVYLVNCNGYVPPSLERKTGSSWEGGWGAVEADCLSPAVVIPDGQSYSDTLTVFAGDYGSRTYPQFSGGHIDGVYRLRWDRALSSFDAYRSGFGSKVPLEYRVSNEFVLRTP
jgi:hypothetical protein